MHNNINCEPFNPLRITGDHWTRRPEWTERSSTCNGQDVLFITNLQKVPVAARMRVDSVFSVCSFSSSIPYYKASF